ncbi:glycosyltransferase [Arthrobacter echini]|uniref:Glycosyltransferase n=1 Tax=Arthrobacter echini TaxID=1529066 RepID=A0A5D0XSK5_9MICC|nr:glycosyltransferase [Arthrobacter echini]TYC99644.1 glycosyltransferase [Arthrobacter echini]
MHDPDADAQHVVIVITTFNRAGHLDELLQSIARLDPLPGGVVVVDNASTDGTADVLAGAQLPCPLLIEHLPHNVGGAGGFAAGMTRALDEGARWLWLMDDDVVVLPAALASFHPWMQRYSCIHGRRYDAAGKPFFWQHLLHESLGVHLPVRGDVFEDSPVFHTNVGCFEGMLVSSEVVREIGLPDARFFLNGDDLTYGWLISRRHPVAYVDAFVLQKTRAQRQIDLGVRHLNDSSDLSRFCGMRNRGHQARYLQLHGSYSRVGFGVGTLLAAGKELVRLVAVERSLTGLAPVWRGWRAARTILRDPHWRPEPPFGDRRAGGAS